MEFKVGDIILPKGYYSSLCTYTIIGYTERYFFLEGDNLELLKFPKHLMNITFWLPKPDEILQGGQ